MGKSRPTEEDLGIEATPDEIAALARPEPQIIEDDVPITQDDEGDPESAHLVSPKPETERPARVKDPATGKFVAKGKDDAPADIAPSPGTKPPPGYTDIRALQEERALRRQTEERMNTLLEVLNKREARAAKADEPAPPAVPDKNIDPLGYIDHIESRLGKIEGETKAQTEARQAQEREQGEFNEVLAVAMPQFNEAKAADPTVEATYSALLENMAKELAYINGIPMDGSATPQQRAWMANEMTNLENSHIRHAVRSGQNVAQYMLQLAAVKGINASPAAAAPAAPQARPQAQRSIPDRRAAQERHMSIGDLPGSATPSQLTAKDIGKMSTKEFAAFAKQMGEAGMDDIMAKLGGVN